MTRKLRSEQSGFTLIELLVVILIIGILAAIALPAFLGQRDKAEDSDAKSMARNLVSHVESCFATEESYVGCDSETELGNTGLEYGTGTGQVSVDTGATATTYTVIAKSDTGTEFSIEKIAGGSSDRDCDQPGEGGCPASGKW